MSRHSALLAVALLCAAAVAVAAGQQQRVLVLADDTAAIKETHSKFLASLKQRGYSVGLKAIGSKSLQLREWDEWLYDKLVIFGRGAALGGAVDVEQLVQFVDAGHDLLLAVDSGVPEEMRALADQLGVDVDASKVVLCWGHLVVDHFDYDATTGAQDHAAVLASNYVQSEAVLPGGFKAPVLYRGVGLSVAPGSETAFAALRGSPTAYSGRAGGAQTEAKLAGPAVALVALVQLRNNARVAVAGSIDMFSDAAFAAEATDRQGKNLGRVANEAFCSAVSKWAFQERGVLQARNLSHRVLSGAHPGAVKPERYRINDEVEFSVDIQECADGACKPFKASDVQVELVMLDPYVRATLSHDGAGHFSTQVKVPDSYGVFKWVVDYRRLGYSYIELTETVPIRPFKHNEYERFIVQAYPYYTSIASMMAGFLAVGAFFLWTK